VSQVQLHLCFESLVWLFLLNSDAQSSAGIQKRIFPLCCWRSYV